MLQRYSICQSRKALQISYLWTMRSVFGKKITMSVLWHLGCSCSDEIVNGVRVNNPYDDVIKWKHFPCYWPFVWGFHRSPVNSPNKDQWRGTLMFTLICAQITGWVKNHEAGDLRRYRGHYDVTVLQLMLTVNTFLWQSWGLSINCHVVGCELVHIMLNIYWCAPHNLMCMKAVHLRAYLVICLVGRFTGMLL